MKLTKTKLRLLTEMNKKVTSSDVAYRAGVAQATVSRALSYSPQVSDSTRNKVIKAAKELNYIVNKSASNLRSQQSKTIALLLFKDTPNNDCTINPFFYPIISSITNTCFEQGYDLLVSFQQNSDDWHTDYGVSNKADGLIFLGYGNYQNHERKLASLVDQGTKFVCWGTHTGNSHIVSVGCDNFKGSKELTQYVINKGKKHIAFLGDITNCSPEFSERYNGYCQALKKQGLSINHNLQINSFYTEKAGYEATNKLINSGEKFDAIYAASDLIAIGAMRTLQEHNISIPEQVAVVGFDDISLSSYASPPLTTVKQDTKLAGELLVSTLIKHLDNNKTVTKVIMTPELVIRESCL
jgi:alanine racemase